jgi:hypothetical protein
MSEPMWMSGDPATFSDSFDDIYEVECDCNWIGEVDCKKEYNNGVTFIYAEWTCPQCKEEHTTERDFDSD